jgi:hypothetical protein
MQGFLESEKKIEKAGLMGMFGGDDDLPSSSQAFVYMGQGRPLVSRTNRPITKSETVNKIRYSISLAPLKFSRSSVYVARPEWGSITAELSVECHLDGDSDDVLIAYAKSPYDPVTAVENALHGAVASVKVTRLVEAERQLENDFRARLRSLAPGLVFGSAVLRPTYDDLAKKRVAFEHAAEELLDAVKRMGGTLELQDKVLNANTVDELDGIRRGLGSIHDLEKLRVECRSLVEELASLDKSAGLHERTRIEASTDPAELAQIRDSLRINREVLARARRFREGKIDIPEAVLRLAEANPDERALKLLEEAAGSVEVDEQQLRDLKKFVDSLPLTDEGKTMVTLLAKKEFLDSGGDMMHVTKVVIEAMLGPAAIEDGLVSATERFNRMYGFQKTLPQGPDSLPNPFLEE